MGGGRASASVRPDESTALPPLPSYDLPLWNEHSKDKLHGVLTRNGSLAKHVKHQEKVFGPFLPCVKDRIAENATPSVRSATLDLLQRRDADGTQSPSRPFRKSTFNACCARALACGRYSARR